MSDRHIHVLYTGGTVGMRRTERGYAPEPGFFEALVESLPPFRAPEMPRFTLEQFDPLLDSANMTPWDWRRIGQHLVEHGSDCDGFLVIHGTDTMAYTASALSFMLEGLVKPVVLTGSQIPLCETRSDALENLITSLLLLGHHGRRIAEVLVCFGGRVLRGNRTTKIDAEGFDAFDSPNLTPLGEVGIDFELDWSRIRGPQENAGPFRVREIGSASVGATRLYPGIQASSLAATLGGVQGLVLECYGAGNAPHRNEPFMRVLREATDAGKVVVAVPQVLHGSADLSLYSTGRALLDAGVVSGFDMTPEAAMTKLAYLFACTDDPRQVRRLVQEDLRGELTRPEDPSA